MQQFWVLRRRPEGEAKSSDFELQKQSLRVDLPPGHILLKTLYLEPHPAMFFRLRTEANYATSLQVGEVMHCMGIAQVVDSRTSGFIPGELVTGMVKMQDWQITDNKDWRKMSSFITEPTEALTLLGGNPFTAYFFLRDLGRPKPGDTLVVSAGAGHVGSMVGQMGKIFGCRTVALCGADKKVEMCLKDFSYDFAINYKPHRLHPQTLTQAVGEACPNGIDIFFDNTSGDLPVALFPLFNEHARWVVCGRVALASLQSDVGPRDASLLITKRVTKVGGLVLDFFPRAMEAIVQIVKWNRNGKLRIPVDIRIGIHKAVQAQLHLLTGNHGGKLLVSVGSPEPIPQPAARSGKFFRRVLEARCFPTDCFVGLLRWRARWRGLFMGV